MIASMTKFQEPHGEKGGLVGWSGFPPKPEAESMLSASPIQLMQLKRMKHFVRTAAYSQISRTLWT